MQGQDVVKKMLGVGALAFAAATGLTRPYRYLKKREKKPYNGAKHTERATNTAYIKK